MIGRPFPPALLGSAGRVSIFVALLLAQLMVLVKPDIVDLGLNMIIDANSDEVHFVKGYLKAPAYIDLSAVRWITNEELVFDFDDGENDYDMEYSLDDEYESPPTFSTAEPEDTSGNNDSTNNEDNANDEGIQDDVGDDISEKEKEGQSDAVMPSENEDNVSEQIDKENADSENISEPLKPETAGDDEGGGAEEGTTNVVENNVAQDQDQQESVTTPTSPERESDIGDEEEKGEPVDEEELENENGDQMEEESSPMTPSGDKDDEGGDEADEVEDNGDKVKEESSPVTPSGDKDDEGGDEADEVEDNGDKVKEESSPVTPSGGKDDEGGDEVEDKGEKSKEEEQDSNGGDRSLSFTDVNPTAIDQVLEIAVFSIPRDCKKDSSGTCDWVTLGVGSYDDEMVGEMSYCCSQDAADRKICASDEVGRMMIDHTIFDGDHRKIQVPSKPLTDFEMDDPLFEVKKSGDYVMVIANCNDDGFGVITLGSMEWKSVGGYLPGEMFDFMFFMFATSAIYLVLGIWYFCGMRSYQDAAIPIQKYILGAIIIGFLAYFLKSIDFLYWNITGVRSNVVMYFGISFGILFQGSLRCLGVMVAMGWGVVRDTIGFAFCKIVVLALLYSGLALLRESFEAAAMANRFFSSNEEEELFDLALVLALVIFFINIIFYVWIISSFRATTAYLKNMNQTSKLRRHLRLRCLVITSLVIITVLTVVNFAQRMAVIVPLIMPDSQIQPFLTTDQMWILKAIGYGNHLFILFGVTILWRPNSDAKDYAMQMQVPTDADDENDLELSCVVPSADDIDIGEGYRIEGAVAT